MHKRTYGGVVTLLAAVLVLGSASCGEPRPDFRGESLTEAEVQGRVVAETERIAREQADRQAAFEIAVAKLDGQRAIDIADLTGRYNADRRSMEDAMASLARDRDSHANAAEAVWAQREGWLGTAQATAETASAFVPALVPWLGVVTTAGTLLGWRRSANRASAATEAVRAVAGGIASLPKGIRERAKLAIGLQADSSDKRVIAKIVAEDELAKLEVKGDEARAALMENLIPDPPNDHTSIARGVAASRVGPAGGAA